MDFKCLRCGEPWDVHGMWNGDMQAWEADMISKGIGCPVCEGEKKAELSQTDLLENDSAMEGEGLEDILTEMQTPGERKYEKPAPFVICECDDCGKKMEVDQDEIFYAGKGHAYFLGEDDRHIHLGEVDEADSDEKVELANERLKYFTSYPDEWSYVTVDRIGKTLCNDCYNNDYFVCDECGEDFHCDDRAAGGDICESCYENVYTECEKCGDTVKCDDTCTIDGMNICGYCERNETSDCDECGETHLSDNLNEVDTQDSSVLLCDGCLESVTFKCANCGDRCLDDEVILTESGEKTCCESCCDTLTKEPNN